MFERKITALADHWLWSALLANRQTYIQVALAAAFTNVIALATSLFTMTVYNRVIPNNATASLVALVIGMAIALVIDFVLRNLRGYFIDIAAQRVDYQVGAALFSKVLDIKIAEKTGSAGGFASVIRDFESLRDFFTSATMVAVVDLPFIALFLAVIALIGGWIVLVPLVAVPLVLIVGLVIQPGLARLAAQAMTEGQSKQGILVETIAGLETVKSISAGPLLEKRWKEALVEQSTTGRRSRILTQFAINSAASIQQVAQVGTIVAGVFLIQSGSLSVGGLIAAMLLAARTLAPLGQLAQLLSRINQARASFSALDRLMAGASEHGGEGRGLRRATLDGAIRFDHVSFRYPGKAQKALDQVSFSVAPGEKVAILGRVGSGKSTITRLILGLYEPEDGAVLVDDTDVRQIDPVDLRANIGSVLQDIVLFSGTVRENIALGYLKADDAEILRVSKLAGVHDFIGQSQAGYDLKLADRGEGLSGGQRQSIAIARALVGSPRIMLLDEPTSAMDTNSENALLSRLEAEFAGRTVILITHRAALLRLVDRVIILDRGKVVAMGPRDDVLKSTAAAGQGAG